MSLATDGQAAAMDRMYRLQRHIYDATRRFYLLGRDHLVRDLRVPPGGSVLEVGCGTGRNLVKVAEAYPDARVFGFDISAEMLKSAGSAVLRHSDPQRVRLAQGDAVTFDPMKTFGVAGFDRVFFSYTLSMIPRWQEALTRAQSLLAADGELHVADFGQCEQLPDALRRALFAWLRRFDVHSRSTLPEVLRSVAENEGLDCCFERLHQGYCWHLVLKPKDRH